MGYFIMNFNGLEILLPKKDVKFKDGYGLVKAYWTTPGEDNVTEVELVGIVNENYEVIMALYPSVLMPKLEILPNGNFVYLLNVDFPNEGYKVYQTDVNLQGQAFDLQNDDFEVIGGSVIKLRMNVDGIFMEALYDTGKKEFLTAYYNRIGEYTYNKELDTEVSLVNLNLYSQDGMVWDIIKTYINREGKIMQPFVDEVYGLEVETDNLEEVVEIFQKEIEGWER